MVAGQAAGRVALPLAGALAQPPPGLAARQLRLALALQPLLPPAHVPPLLRCPADLLQRAGYAAATREAAGA